MIVYESHFQDCLTVLTAELTAEFAPETCMQISSFLVNSEDGTFTNIKIVIPSTPLHLPRGTRRVAPFSIFATQFKSSGLCRVQDARITNTHSLRVPFFFLVQKATRAILVALIIIESLSDASLSFTGSSWDSSPQSIFSSLLIVSYRGPRHQRQLSESLDQFLIQSHANIYGLLWKASHR